eukprot:gnl/MRDRNA2_/MRDRNA2_30383_c0_seq1.p1 gnl/MRDRNA2_/MRDRNA2_30383_c0~~gnl/MRDRNA2_/MRDRNA2_30383_c0_seq1.p1  ORF type:complete len:559 (+),score=101.12 gnl/MRDRNA2_/MRDRNA2_30383_c0_seq1:161-1678(+)
MTVHFFEYLSFQKRLSMITDTFHGIFDELIHIGLVLLAVCFTLGTMSSLAFGAFDPSFRDFFPSLLEMLEQCFQLFKPAAVQSYNPPLFKYVPHVLIGNHVMHWAPQAVTLVFKTLVMLLLFKLLMGVIMEGYKSHSKQKNYPYTLRTELKMLGGQLYQYLWRHRICGEPYVSFEQVVISLSLIRESGKVDKDKPWRSRYLGFSCDIHEVQKVLNNVYTGDLPTGVDPGKRPKIKAVAKHYKFKNCEAREAKWVLEQYGIPRQIAMHHLAEYVKRKEEKKVMERLREERKHAHPTEEEEMKRCAKAHADDALKEMERKLTQAVHRGVESADSPRVANSTEMRLNLQFKLDDDVLKSVFDQYDVYGIGEINVKFMSQALGVEAGLGFDVPRDICNQLLQKYDENDNRSYDFEEFRQLVSDPMLQGRYVGNQHQMKSRKSAAIDFKVAQFVERLKVSVSRKTSKVRFDGLKTQPLLGDPTQRRSHPARSHSCPPGGGQLESSWIAVE